MVSKARRRAVRQSLPFNLTVEDITIPAACPVLGIPLSVAAGRADDNSPSLDRIIPCLGYVRGNVVVISWRANRMKSDATLEELRLLASFYERIANARVT